MSEISRAALFGKLNPTLYKSLQNATSFCKLRGNSYVELVHWLHQMMHVQNTDFEWVMKRFNVNMEALAEDIIIGLDLLPAGASSVSDLSEHIETSVQQAWTYGSLKFQDNKIRSAYLIYAMLKTSPLKGILLNISAEFNKVTPDVLAQELSTIVVHSVESQSAEQGSLEQGAVHSLVNHSMQNGESALQKYGVNLTEKAKKGEIDPISGRSEEIRQIIDILMRRRQNNPILTGEAGVGKTAVVEALATRLASGDVPPILKNVQLILLDIGLLKAGASVSGEFESRLRQVIDEVQSSPVPVVLFIDEIHTLIGAGGAAGTADAANLLKPALARGQLRTIGATTWAEYKKYFEKDSALTRRFQVVQVHEPSEDQAILMLRGLAYNLEQHHKILILDEAVEAAVRLSHRYIPARQLPDKAVSLMDTACARVAISQYATPSQIEYLQRQIESLALEKEIVSRELNLNIGQPERLASIEESLAEAQSQLGLLDQRWQEEKQLVEQILRLRARLMDKVESEEQNLSSVDTGAQIEQQEAVEQVTTDEPNFDCEALAEQLAVLNQELEELQAKEPLILSVVDAHAVATVVADWTGIPVGKMVKDEVEAVLTLADTLNQRVIGQRHGLDAIVRRIQTSRVSLDDPNKPIGVFMLAGPSGVGKTETALALAESLYGGEQNVITINMSEYQEAHTVSTLKGAPPGYVGYGEGGVLTEAVRRRPYSVILLDEVEKAHPDVHEVFFQVFDKGWMEDGEGRYIDFKNTIIILTTNVGTELIMDMCQDPELMPEPEALGYALREPMLKVFPAALLGRMQVIPYYPLSDEMLGAIVRLQLQRVVDRIFDNHNITLKYSDQVVSLIVSRCTEIESGGRMVYAILTNAILPKISYQLLLASTQEQTISSIFIDVKDDDFTYEYQ
ncbi:type VI secretion system ATPase TssH [Neisseria sp. Ec49-e6-T10]|uniref:type VI secretion system ATPase TssH n=1 Tax=Neisseria sp. Ec49-e6-T10 TaxID=3140744 RepID=UPI003EB83042